jgi:hypothetical protein
MIWIKEELKEERMPRSKSRNNSKELGMKKNNLSSHLNLKSFKLKTNRRSQKNNPNHQNNFKSIKRI